MIHSLSRFRKQLTPFFHALSLHKSHQKWSIVAISKLEQLHPHFPASKSFTQSCGLEDVFSTLQLLSAGCNIANLSLFYRHFHGTSSDALYPFTSATSELYCYDWPWYFHEVEAALFPPYSNVRKKFHSDIIFPQVLLFSGTIFSVVAFLNFFFVLFPFRMLVIKALHK